MKKVDFSRKISKRKSVSKDYLKKFKNDQVDSSKDIVQIVNEKLVSETQSVWSGSELLYIIRTQRRGKKLVQQDQQAKSTSNPKHDKYIAMLRKKDVGHNISIVKVNVKEDDVDMKNNFDLKVLRAIDFGSEDNELLLSFDNADHNLYFSTQTERDETLWIIIQVCKYVVGNDVSIGYSIDIDALTYITSTNGTLSRFPLLQKMINAHSKELGDFFSNEETEAETLLDELNWGSSLQDQTDLQHTLSKQSGKLSDEIIDFLLQWEEMDDNSNPSSKRSSMRVTGGGVSDTSEVLTALSQVDVELEAVDKWLEEQVGRLAEVQANLHMIEDESSALESSWQSLGAVQEVVTLLVKRYSLSDAVEKVLQNPDQIISPILKSPQLYKIEDALKPLLEAMNALRDALKLKFNDVADMTAARWKQLQNMTSIASQRAKLADLVDQFCSAFSDTALGIFDWLLKHKALNDANSSVSIIVKSFDFEDLLTECNNVRNRNMNGAQSGPLCFTPAWFTKIRSLQQNQLLKARSICEMYLLPFIPLLSVYTELAPSQVQPVRDAYVRATAERFYVPLLKALGRDLLTITTNKRVLFTLANCGRYQLKKDKSAAASSVNSFQSGKLAPGNDNQLPPWITLKIGLMALIPALAQEELFLKNSFNLANAQSGYMLANSTAAATTAVVNNNITANSTTTSVVTGHMKVSHQRLMDMMDGLFEQPVQKFLVTINVKSPNNNVSNNNTSSSAITIAAAAPIGSSNNNSSSSSATNVTTDGIEALGMLSIVIEFEVAYREAALAQYENNALSFTVPSSSSSSSAKTTSSSLPSHHQLMDDDDEESASNSSASLALALYSDQYLVRVLEGIRTTLIARVNAFASEQAVWLRAQKADPKAPEVLLPFANFPTLVAQVVEMSNGLHIECVDDLLHKLARELFQWLTLIAKQNDKYTDKIKITNFGYFILAIGPMQLEALDSFMINATQQRHESMGRYVHWMVSYEYPALSALAVRLDGLGRKVNEEELSLYIRRKDVLNVVKELEVKGLESKVSTLRKRLEKHFRSDFDKEMRLVDRAWAMIRDRVVNILSRLEDAASLSYQIKLEVGPLILRNLFEKYSGGKERSTNNELINKELDL